MRPSVAVPRSGAKTPLSHSFCQYVVEDGAALVVEDAREDERLASNLAISDLGVIAYAGYPIRTRDGDVLGCSARSTTGHACGRQATSSPRGAALAPRRRRRAALGGRRAADAGRRLQRALVPEPPPLPGAVASAVYRPGEQRSLLGGDFFVCEALPDGTIALLVGDVAGHGPEAAAFAMSLRSAWRALQLAPLTLEEKAARLNTIALAQQPRIGVFATALLCAITPDRATAQVINAGHPPLVLLDGEGAREAASPPAPPLGVIRDATFAAGTVELGAGAALLAYTDGLVEGRAAPAPTSGSARARCSRSPAPCTRRARTATRCWRRSSSSPRARAGSRPPTTSPRCWSPCPSVVSR